MSSGLTHACKRLVGVFAAFNYIRWYFRFTIDNTAQYLQSLMPDTQSIEQKHTLLQTNTEMSPYVERELST